MISYFTTYITGDAMIIKTGTVEGIEGGYAIIAADRYSSAR
jgi:hypothetical protein